MGTDNIERKTEARKSKSGSKSDSRSGSKSASKTGSKSVAAAAVKRPRKKQGAKGKHVTPPITDERNSRLIDGTTFGFSIALLLACVISGIYSGTLNTVGADFLRILISPAPLVTDYFGLGSISAAFLNAGLCGLTMACFMFFLPGHSHVNTLAGFFLVISHCFYGLNFLNMWPCFLPPFLYLAIKGLDYNKNLHVCMFATSFAPFVSEFLFRYTQGENFRTGTFHLTFRGTLLTIIFMLITCFIAPVVLPDVKAWHKGYLLYNGGLAYGMIGFLIYSFMYKTMGAVPPLVPIRHNSIYNSFHNSYRLFGNIFFAVIFLTCLLVGWYLNGKTFHGFRHFLQDTGYHSNFARKYGMPLCLINIGNYGLLFLVYINISIHFTKGAGFTGPTFGVILAALTFTCMGQHVRNVWPIILGYPLLSLLVYFFNFLIGGNATWTISNQSYINSVAFATGLCPIVGRYGSLAGIAAGMLCAALCTSTSALHGGLMLYNGGFTAGIAALILIPVLEHYVRNPRSDMDQHVDIDLDLHHMITLNTSTMRTPVKFDLHNLITPNKSTVQTPAKNDLHNTIPPNTSTAQAPSKKKRRKSSAKKDS